MRSLRALAFLVTMFWLVAPLAAQDAAPAAPAGDLATASEGETSGGGGSGGDVSFFKAFFWPDGDVVGLLIVWSLVIASTASIGYAILLFLNYRRERVLPPEIARQLEKLLAEKKYREAIEAARSDRSFLSVVTAAALEEAPHGYGAMERAVEEAADAEVSRMLRPIELLNVLGNIAPMVGLFGTVYGMIVAFQQLVAAGGRPDPAMLAGGISTALVTTFWGLVVAIPALACYALIRNRIDAMASEGVLLVESLIGTFKPVGRRRDGDAATPRPRTAPQPRPDRSEGEV